MPQTGGLDFVEWSFVDSEQLGVAAIDPVGHKIGPNIAYRTGVGLNWYPIDRFKHILVGSIDRYQFFDGLGDEADWNIFIKPNNAFSFVLDDALPNADPDLVHRCEHSSGFCLEAEVTPDESFYDNPFFPKDGDSPLVGRQVGVYGPWVAEEAHGWRPEIHPSEAIWWRDGESGLQNPQTYHLVVVQDDSNRFDRSDNFSGQISRPWSKPPVTIEFRIAVEVPYRHSRLLTIEEVFGRNIVGVTPADTPNESQVDLSGGAVVAGRTYVSARKSLTDGTHVAVSFEQFTPIPTNHITPTGFRGYVKLHCRVGLGDRGDEGYAVFKVTAQPPQPTVVLVDPMPLG